MANQIKTALALSLLGLAIFLAGNHLHALWDRDEPRYAVATREMVETGDWVIPHFNGEIRYDKPIFIYWLMAIPMSIFGMNEFGARFISGLMGALRVGLMFWFALRIGCSRGGAVVAALIGAFSGLLLVISKAATIDSSLVLCLIGAMFLYWEQRQSGFRWWRHVLFYALMGVAALLKGPVGPAIVIMAILMFEAWSWWISRKGNESLPPVAPTVAIRAGRIAAGVAVFFAVALPWAILAWIRSDPPGDFLLHSFQRHVVERSRTEMEGHGGPFFYYLPVMLAAFFPFTAVWLQGLGMGWKERHRPIMAFLWSWVIPGFIMFSAVSTKLPHYIAPLVPALALMTGLWWTGREQKRLAPGPRWLRISGAILVAMVGAGAFMAVPVAMAVLGVTIPWAPVFLTTALIFAGTAFGAWFWIQQREQIAVGMWTGGWLAALLLGLHWSLPALDAVRPSKQVGHWIRENAPPGTRLYMSNFTEPSLVFYSAGQFTTIGSRQHDVAFDILRDRENPSLIVLTARRWVGYQKDQRASLPEGAEIKLDREYFYFEKGEPIQILVIGTW